MRFYITFLRKVVLKNFTFYEKLSIHYLITKCYSGGREFSANDLMWVFRNKWMKLTGLFYRDRFFETTFQSLFFWRMFIFCAICKRNVWEKILAPLKQLDGCCDLKPIHPLKACTWRISFYRSPDSITGTFAVWCCKKILLYIQIEICLVIYKINKIRFIFILTCGPVRKIKELPDIICTMFHDQKIYQLFVE